MINRAGQIFEVKSTKSILMIVSSEPLSQDSERSTKHNYMFLYSKGVYGDALLLRQGIEDTGDSWDSHRLLTRIG
jgi:hypothetical protein